MSRVNDTIARQRNVVGRVSNGSQRRAAHRRQREFAGPLPVPRTGSGASVGATHGKKRRVNVGKGLWAACMGGYARPVVVLVEGDRFGIAIREGQGYPYHVDIPFPHEGIGRRLYLLLIFLGQELLHLPWCFH
jgi:hypothetical protein